MKQSTHERPALDAAILNGTIAYSHYDPIHLASAHPSIKDAYEASGMDQRVRVRNELTGAIRTGVVRISPGSRPRFLLMRKVDSGTSSHLIDQYDHVVGTSTNASRMNYREGTPFGYVYPPPEIPLNDSEADEFGNRLERILREVNLRNDPKTAIVMRWHEERRSWYFQVHRMRPDSTTGIEEPGHGGKFYVSPHMITSEIVQGLWGIYQGYVLHEAREAFTYRGVAIYGPHIDVEALVDAAQNIAVRPPQENAGA